MGSDGLTGIGVASMDGRMASAPSRRAGKRFRSARRVRSILPLMPLGVFLGLALLGPLLIPTSPSEQELLARLQPPAWAGGTWDHPLGTDGLGRDLLARIAIGARFSLLVGVVATALAGAVGVLLGAFAGLTGGWADRAISALVTVEMAVPAIVIGIVITATLGQGLQNLLLILLLGGWVIYARIVRLQAMALRRSEFVEAALALGASRWHVLRRHLLPNLAPTVLVLLAQGVAAVMVYEATLSYLGLGVSIETVTLGALVREGQTVLFAAWWVGLFPGLAIALVVVGCSLLADAMQSRMRLDRSMDLEETT